MANLLNISTLFLACACTAVNSFDVKQFREIKYSEIDSNVDIKWMGSVNTWYVPLWSKLHRARTIADVLEKPVSELTDKEWTTPSCGVFDGSNVYSGFNRRTPFGCSPSMDASGKMDGFSCKAPWSGATNVNLNFKLTDNKSYILGVAEQEGGGGDATWVVLSTTATLKEKDEHKIRRMLNGLGFREHLAFVENYEGCKIGKVEL